MITIKKSLYLLTVLSTLMISCSDDDSPSTETPETDSGITMVLKATGGDEPEYVVSSTNIMEGTISAVGNGFESLDWNFVYNVDDTGFVLGYTNFEAQVYQENEGGEVEEVAKFILETPLEVFGNVDDEVMLAIDAPRDGSHTTRKLYSIDAETGYITSITDLSIYDLDTGTPGEGLSAWPSALEVVGDKLFISYYLVDDLGYYSTPDPDKAYVAIYSYPNVESAPIKIIEDDRTSNIGVNGTTTGLIQADNGNLYSYSCGTEMGGFSPKATKPSGILRINSGSTDFDESYFFNIEEAYNGGSIFWFDYVGNNKAIARILTSDEGGAWAAFGRDVFNQKLVIIDLENQTITDVENVPLHAKRYTSPVNVIDGKVYVSIETATDAYVYQVDIDTAVGTKGAKIEGKTIKGFFEL